MANQLKEKPLLGYSNQQFNDTLVIKYDASKNYSQQKIEQLYVDSSIDLLDFLHSNGIELTDLLENSSLDNYIHFINNLVTPPSFLVSELADFSESLENIEYDRESDRELALTRTIDKIVKELTKWDTRHTYSVSNKIFNVKAASFFLKEVDSYADSAKDLLCIIESNKIVLPNGEVIYSLQGNEHNYIPYLFTEFSACRERMENNLEILDFFRKNTISNRYGFVEFIGKICHIVTKKPNKEWDDSIYQSITLALQSSHGKQEEDTTENLSFSDTIFEEKLFTLLLAVYESNEGEIILEALRSLALEWHGSAKELVETAIILIRN